jgi:hypothetical protein
LKEILGKLLERYELAGQLHAVDVFVVWLAGVDIVEHADTLSFEVSQAVLKGMAA